MEQFVQRENNGGYVSFHPSGESPQTTGKDPEMEADYFLYGAS